MIENGYSTQKSEKPQYQDVFEIIALRAVTVQQKRYNKCRFQRLGQQIVRAGLDDRNRCPDVGEPSMHNYPAGRIQRSYFRDEPQTVNPLKPQFEER